MKIIQIVNVGIKPGPQRMPMMTDGIKAGAESGAGRDMYEAGNKRPV
jgi:hypothetical protein